MRIAPRVLLALAGALVLASCSVLRAPPRDTAPTIGSLAGRAVELPPDPGVLADEATAIAAYEAFLKSAPADRQRPAAVRRLGDLEMDRAEGRPAPALPAPAAGVGAVLPAGVPAPAPATGTALPPRARPDPVGTVPARPAPRRSPPAKPPATAAAAAPAAAAPPAPEGTEGDYRRAIARYLEVLKTYPDDPANDHVLYQLARARELSGELDGALATLDELVRRYPDTRHADEAHFRRGEMNFALRDYAAAERAFATVLRGDRPSPFRERALYMQGWALFKQGRLDEALQPFLGVLDLRAPQLAADGELAALPGLSRADRELVEDTFRVASLALENLQGAATIPALVSSPQRRAYEFRIYEQLGELYLKQERVKDAADAFGAFARRQPLHPQAPVMQARVIEIYEQGGFETLSLQAKKDYVGQYGRASAMQQASPAGWERAQPLVRTHLAELARGTHARAQKSRAAADYDEAARWYRELLAAFPADPQAAEHRFLLAELLFEDRRFEPAAAEYETTAYALAPHPRSADAGYAALLAYAARAQALAGPAREAVQRAGVDSAVRFADRFGTDPRTGAVLANAADTLFTLGDGARAAGLAQRLLALDPPAAAAQRRVAATVIAHVAFERGEFARAEAAYREVLPLVPEREPARAALAERLAASIYRQGEQAAQAGRPREAVGHFERVAAAAPAASIRATAQFDAAAAWLALKDWEAAARTLEDFRRRFPGHALQPEVGGKLALAYLEQGRWAAAAGEFERVAAAARDPEVARAARWQVAELHEKAGARDAAVRAYEQYLKQYREPAAVALEARWRLAGLAKQRGDAPRAARLLREVLDGDRAAGAARSDRTRFLGASAALALAEPVRDAYRQVQLVEPLRPRLKLKKQRMEEALKAYRQAAEYGVAEVSTAALFHTAELYRDFGRALLDSQRPRGLSKAEREQYDVLLEEQAFPFEEQALALHETNARSGAKGVFDDWVQRSYAALAAMRPLRYGKTERSVGTIDAIR